jgi:Family of unknown function (DUF695)
MLMDNHNVNFDEFNWTLAKDSCDGNQVLVRFRQFPRDFGKVTYSIRLNIFWKMSEVSAIGLPLPAETIRLEEFEDHIVEATEPDQQAVLSMVLTGDSQREFVFHTRDDQVFLARLTAMPQRKDPYPIEIRRSVDPGWQYDERVKSSIIVQDPLH